MCAMERISPENLDAQIAKVKDDVRRAPDDPRHRTFLFQLLVVKGDWERALTQLTVVSELDAGALPMAGTYRIAIQAEALRRAVFAGQRGPLLFGEPQPWIAMLLEALQSGARGDHAGAAALREKAFDHAPATSGMIDGMRFEWIADGDTRIGPMIEAIFNGGYYWVPINRLQAVRIEAPSDLRDLVWMPAELRFANGGEMTALIPTRYPGAEDSADPQIMLGAKTTWEEPAPGSYIGSGQRTWVTDSHEHAIMDTRVILFDKSPPPADAPEAGTVG